MGVSYRVPEKDRWKDCKICKTEYVISEYWSLPCDDPYGDEYGPTKSCPNCNYNPEYELEVSSIIKNNFNLTINSNGISCNTRELSDLVIKRLQEIWPKGNKNE